MSGSEGSYVVIQHMPTTFKSQLENLIHSLCDGHKSDVIKLVVLKL